MVLAVVNCFDTHVGISGECLIVIAFYALAVAVLGGAVDNFGDTSAISGQCHSRAALAALAVVTLAALVGACGFVGH